MSEIGLVGGLLVVAWGAHAAWSGLRANDGAFHRLSALRIPLFDGKRVSARLQVFAGVLVMVTATVAVVLVLDDEYLAAAVRPPPNWSTDVPTTGMGTVDAEEYAQSWLAAEPLDAKGEVRLEAITLRGPCEKESSGMLRTDTLELFSKLGLDSELVRESTTLVAGVRGWVYELVVASKPRRRVRAYLVPAGRSCLYLRYSATLDRFDQYLPAFEQSADATRGLGDPLFRFEPIYIASFGPIAQFLLYLVYARRKPDEPAPRPSKRKRPLKKTNKAPVAEET